MTDPVFREFLYGSLASGLAQRNYLLHLMFQAAVLFVWWPKQSLADVLQTGHGPSTLVAVCTAAGVSLAYFNLRAGAEELLLEGQQSLREWALFTPRAAFRLCLAYLAGCSLQILFLLLLSLPLIMVAYAPGGGTPVVLGWLLLMLAVQTGFFRLLAAVIYMAIGHHGILTYLSLRGALLVVFVGSLILAPVGSQLVVARGLILGTEPTWLNGVSIPAHVAFLALYGMTSLALLAALWWLLIRQRQAAAHENGVLT